MTKQRGSLSDEYVSVHTQLIAVDSRAAGNIAKWNKMAEKRQRL
jgi:hypothetical protein